MTSPIPDGMMFETAAVLPPGLSTAACGLFETGQLGLDHPCHPARIGKTLLDWGGSTSVGSNAIKLAVAAGYDVITTTSPRNVDYCRALGATQIFDYQSRTVVRSVKALNGRPIAGALAVGLGSAGPCLDVVHACDGDKAVSIASQSVSFEDSPARAARTVWLARKIPQLLGSKSL